MEVDMSARQQPQLDQKLPRPRRRVSATRVDVSVDLLTCYVLTSRHKNGTPIYPTTKYLCDTPKYNTTVRIIQEEEQLQIRRVTMDIS
jgi:hypothetical protein